MVYLMGRTGDGSPREQGMGGVWEAGVERVGGGCGRNSGNKQHCFKYFTTKKAIKQRKPRKKREELGMQGTGGGRFAPLLFPLILLFKQQDLLVINNYLYTVAWGRGVLLEGHSTERCLEGIN